MRGWGLGKQHRQLGTTNRSGCSRTGSHGPLGRAYGKSVGLGCRGCFSVWCGGGRLRATTEAAGAAAAVGGLRAGVCVGPCKHGHRHPPALAMRCIAAAASGHGNGLRPTLNPTEKGLKGATRLGVKQIWGLSVNFRVPAKRGFRVGWRRCNTSLRRGSGRMRARSQFRQRTAGRGRSPAPTPASVFARSARPGQSPALPSLLCDFGIMGMAL